MTPKVLLSRPIEPLVSVLGAIEGERMDMPPSIASAGCNSIYLSSGPPSLAIEEEGG